MDSAQTRFDPIHTGYYEPLDSAEAWGDGIFYLAAILSIVVLFVDRTDHPTIFGVLNVFFALAVIAGFVIGLAVRLYWMPRADAARTHDFFAKAYGVPLTHLATVGYYNNDASDPAERVAAQTLENAFFSKHIALRMLRFERARAIIYMSIWCIAVLNRTTDIGLVVGISQIVFGEQIVSRWFRLEWLRQKSETTYSTLYQLFQTCPRDSASFRAQSMAALIKYETAKSTAAATLSTEVFNNMNDALTAEWETIKQTLEI